MNEPGIEPMDLILTIDDRVMFKEGGPVLFVEGVHSNQRLICSWMDGMGQRHQAAFLTDDLTKLEPVSFAELAKAVGNDNDTDDDDAGRVRRSVDVPQSQTLKTIGEVAYAALAVVSWLAMGRRQKGLQAQ
jgi:uncharacterized protein YodC (DUF2158 family)